MRIPIEPLNPLDKPTPGDNDVAQVDPVIAAGSLTGSFTVDIVKEAGIAAKIPHYRLTIRRIRIDECKAFLVDGVLIELDLEKDLGLEGAYTISVVNPVYRRPGGAS